MRKSQVAPKFAAFVIIAFSILPAIYMAHAINGITNSTDIHPNSSENIIVSYTENTTSNEDVEQTQEITTHEPAGNHIISRISQLIFSPPSPIIGDILDIKALLTYDNFTPIPGQEMAFYQDKIFLGTNQTDESGWSQIAWIPNISGTYLINATYFGNQTHNTTTNSTSVVIDITQKIKDKETTLQLQDNQTFALKNNSPALSSASNPVPISTSEEPRTTYGDGYSIKIYPDGTKLMTDGVKTYKRYDGIYRPAEEMNINTGNWTYLIQDTGTYYNITADNISFRLSKNNWMHYDFSPDKIKETMIVHNRSDLMHITRALNANTRYLPLEFNPTGNYTHSGNIINFGRFKTTDIWIMDNGTAANNYKDNSYYNINENYQLKVVDGQMQLFFDNVTWFQNANYPLVIDPTWTLGNDSGNSWTNVVYSDTKKHNDQHVWIENNITDYISYWDLEEGSGSSGTNDLNQTNINNGVLINVNITGNATSGWTAGQYGTGLRFNKNNDYVNISHSLSLSITGNMTLEAWIYSYKTNVVNFIVGKEQTGADSTKPYGLYQTNLGKAAFVLGSGSASPTVKGGTTINANQWYHFVGTVDGTSMNIYLNGISDATPVTFTGGRQSNTLPVDIGKWVNTYCNCTIDEVKIFNRALSASEVETEYNKTFRQTGNLTSNTKDAESIGSIGDTWENITYAGITPANTNVSIWINSSSDGSTWSGYSLLQSAAVSGTTYTLNAGDKKRYISWRLVLEGNLSATPEVYNVTMTSLILSDTQAPTYSLNMTNTTVVGSPTLFSLYCQDNIGLSGYIFSFDNGTGTFSNDTFVEMTGTGNWSNVTKSVNTTVGATIQWRVYANDSSGNMNTSQIFSITTTTETTPPTLTLHVPSSNGTYSTTPPYFNGTCTDSDGISDIWTNISQYNTSTTSPFNLTNSTPLSSQRYDVNLSCNDTLGNIATRIFWFLYTKQINVSISLNSTTVSQSASLTVLGQALYDTGINIVANNSINLFLDGQQLKSCGNGTISTTCTWWNTSWPYRKAITINGSTTAQTDYQVNLTINWTRGMNTTFDDLRFTYYNTTASAENTIPHWVESNISGTNSTIWIKTNLTTGNNTVYVYYGNPTASYNNSLGGNNTFEFFDDFADASKWTEDSISWSISGGVYTGSGIGFFSKTTNYNITDGIIETRQKTASGAYYHGLFFRYTDSNNYYGMTTTGGNDRDYILTKVAGVFTEKSYTDMRNGDNAYHRIKGVINGASLGFYRDGSLISMSVGSNPASDSSFSNGKLALGGLGQNGQLDTDLIYVRKYASSEASVLSIGVEQSASLTNSTGHYNFTFTAPSSIGSYTIKVNLTNPDGITGSNQTTLNVADLTLPAYTLNQTNSTVAGTDVLFSLYWTDNNALAGYIFSFDNGTGTFANDTFVAMTGTGNWSNVTKHINSTIGATIMWRIYANDSTGNMNSSIIYSYITTSSDSTPPTLTIQSPVNTTYGATTSWFNITGSEPLNWSGYSLDGAPNITLTNSSGNWNSQNITMTFKHHTVRFFANDSAGNMNSSEIIYFTVENITVTETLNTSKATQGQIVAVSGQATHMSDSTAVANNTINIYLDDQQLKSCGNGTISTTCTWWNTTWPYRKAITINGSTTAQTDYQVLVNLTSSNFNFSRANSQGNDTRFTWLNTTSNTEQNVSFWIENWTSSGSNGNATIWVKVPNITASSVANTTLYMYYGNPLAIYNNTLNFNNTFTKNYNTTRLIGLWHMDEGTGNTADSSGNGNTGTVNGATWNTTDGGQWDSRSDVSFITGAKLQFDGSNDYVGLTGTSILKPSTYTIESWIIPNDVSNYQTIFSFHYNDVLVTINASGNPQIGNYYTGSGGSKTSTSPTSISKGLWYHVAGTYDGTNITLYINGLKRDSITCGGITWEAGSSYPPRIGSYANGAYYFNGSIDEVSIYNQSLSADEIYRHYIRSKYASPEPSVLSVGSEQTTSMTNSTGGYSFTFTAPSTDGLHTVKVNLTDSNNIYGENTTSFTVDGTAPTVTLISPVSNYNTSATSVSFTFNVTDNLNTSMVCSLYINGTQISTNTSTLNATTTTFTNILVSASLNQNWTVSCSDSINTHTPSNRTFNVDTTSPVLTLHTPATNGTYYSIPPYLNGTCTDNAAISDIWTNITNYSTHDSTSPFNFTNTSVLLNQRYDVNITCNDTAGNQQSLIFYFTYDSVQPNITFVNPTRNNNTYTNNNYTYINVSVSDTLSGSNLTSFIDFNRSLVGWWRFNREAGENDTFARDWSTWGNNGTISGTNKGIDNGSSGWTTSGKFGYGMMFDGNDDYVDAGNVASLSFSKINPISISAWIKTNDPGSHGVILSKSDNTVGYFFSALNDGGQLKLLYQYFNNAGGAKYKYRYGNTNLADNKWHHVFSTYNGSDNILGIRLYVDGIEQTYTNGESGTVSDITNSFSVKIGKRSDGLYFNGTIDELSIYNRVLEADEINASYNTGLYRLYHNFTNLTEGNYTYTAYAQDLAGNVNQTETRTLTVDTTQPFISFVSPTDSNNSYVGRNWTYINTTITDILSPNNLSAFIDFNRSLVGWWRFNREEGENDTFVRDWSTWGNNGTMKNMNSGIDNCTGNCSGWTANGKFGYSVKFDKINDYIDVGNSTSLNITAYTIEAWIKTGSDATQEILSKSSATRYTYVLRLVTGRPAIMTYDGTTLKQHIFSDFKVNDSLWHHAAGIKNSTHIYLFVDGVYDNVPIDISALGDTTNNVAVNIGEAEGVYFNGTMDEVKIWNRALSPEEINASYNTGLYRLYHNFTNLTQGTYTYTAYSQDLAGNTNQTETRTVTVDTTPPGITIQSPTNTTYSTSSVWFNTTLSETGSSCAYSLDSAANQSMTNSTGNWWSKNTTMALGSHSMTFSCNDTSGNMNSTAALYFSIYNTTSIDTVTIDSTTPNVGDIVNIAARLINASENPIASQNMTFYYNQTYIGYNITNTTGWAVYMWDTTGVTQSGTYKINATFSGNTTTYQYQSYNDTTEITMSYRSITVHEYDNATDKLWGIQSLPVDFSYYCYAGLAGCDDTKADNSDGDGTPANFTIENTGDSVDIVAYVTSDYDSSKYYICSSNETGADGDSASCINAPSANTNGADNLQVYIPAISQWRSIPNTARDGTASALAVGCDISAASNVSGIDFRVRSPYGTHGSYSTIIRFVAYSDICTNGQEGYYFQP